MAGASAAWPQGKRRRAASRGSGGAGRGGVEAVQGSGGVGRGGPVVGRGGPVATWARIGAAARAWEEGVGERR
jgi:hypothetical protein